MENKLENKAKFFAQYWGQNIMRFNLDSDESVYDAPVGAMTINNRDFDNIWIELKPLSQITDEDVVKVAIDAGYNGSDYTYEEMLSLGKALVKAIDKYSGTNWPVFKVIRAVDALRRLGFAVEFDGVTVFKQIEWGWVKLKQ